MCMPHTNIAEAEMVGERLRSEVERRMPFTISVGVAAASDADTPESRLKRADDLRRIVPRPADATA